MQHDWAATAVLVTQPKPSWFGWRNIMKHVPSDSSAQTDHLFWRQFRQLQPLLAHLKRKSVRQIRASVREILPHCRTIQQFKTLLGFIGHRNELRSLVALVRCAWEQLVWRDVVKLEMSKPGKVTRWWFRLHRAQYQKLLFRYPFKGTLSAYINGLFLRFG